MLIVQNMNKNRKQGGGSALKARITRNRKQLLLSMVQVGVDEQKKWLTWKDNFAFEEGFKGRAGMLIFWGALKI